MIDLVRWIGEDLGVSPRIEFLPDQPGDVPITYADVAKAKQVLGYAPKVPSATASALRRVVSLESIESRLNRGKAGPEGFVKPCGYPTVR